MNRSTSQTITTQYRVLLHSCIKSPEPSSISPCRAFPDQILLSAYGVLSFSLSCFLISSICFWICSRNFRSSFRNLFTSLDARFCVFDVAGPPKGSILVVFVWPEIAMSSVTEGVFFLRAQNILVAFDVCYDRIPRYLLEAWFRSIQSRHWVVDGSGR